MTKGNELQLDIQVTEVVVEVASGRHGDGSARYSIRIEGIANAGEFTSIRRNGIEFESVPVSFDIYSSPSAGDAPKARWWKFLTKRRAERVAADRESGLLWYAPSNQPSADNIANPHDEMIGDIDLEANEFNYLLEWVKNDSKSIRSLSIALAGNDRVTMNNVDGYREMIVTLPADGDGATFYIASLRYSLSTAKRLSPPRPERMLTITLTDRAA